MPGLCTEAEMARCIQNSKCSNAPVDIAQWVEQPTHNRSVTGSTPVIQQPITLLLGKAQAERFESV